MMRSSATNAMLILFPVLLMLVPLSLAQDVSRESFNGSIQLTAGFESDPRSISVVAGGSIDLSESTFLQDCVGLVSDAPDYELDYLDASSEFSLGFYAEGDVDTVLLINDPEGNWHCNDDFGEEYGLMAGIRFEPALTGVYDIWVGVYDEEDNYAEVDLYITELNDLLDAFIADSDLFEEDESSASGGVSSTGTGFVVSENGHILTNYHVVEDCSRVTFQLLGARQIDVDVLAENEQYDLALLGSELGSQTAAFSAQQNLRLGDEVVVYGYPLFGNLSSQGNITTGVVSALTGLNDDLANFQMSAQIQPGNSGGPVLNRAGSVVGVVVSMANEDYFSRQSGAIPQNVNFAINAGIARLFLDANNVQYARSTSTDELSTADIAERAQTYTGVLSCHN